MEEHNRPDGPYAQPKGDVHEAGCCGVQDLVIGFDQRRTEDHVDIMKNTEEESREDSGSQDRKTG